VATMLFSFIESVQELFNTDLITYGGTTITIGAIVIAVLKLLLPNGKTNKENTFEINKLKNENAELGKRVEENEKKIKELNGVINQIIENSTNKKIKSINSNFNKVNIGEHIEELVPVVTEVVNKVKKVKVKKGKK
jgi:UDP-N-acetylglucosamine:LPS N-acetylglucosamine transferase